MSALTFRNRLGELVELPTVAATQFKKAFGSIFDRAAHGEAVAITRHDAPKVVLISYEEFEAMMKTRNPSIEALSAEFDMLLAGMQTPKARASMKAAFHAAPAAAGRAAVKAARKKR